MKAAIAALATLHPKKIVLAVPVASKESAHEIRPLVAQFICPHLPEPFHGVGQWYQSFPQTSDEEVIDLLEKIQTHFNNT